MRVAKIYEESIQLSLDKVDSQFNQLFNSVNNMKNIVRHYSMFTIKNSTTFTSNMQELINKRESRMRWWAADG